VTHSQGVSVLLLARRNKGLEKDEDFGLNAFSSSCAYVARASVTAASSTWSDPHEERPRDLFYHFGLLRTMAHCIGSHNMTPDVCLWGSALRAAFLGTGVLDAMLRLIRIVCKNIIVIGAFQV
jgi:hypothetical protein